MTEKYEAPVSSEVRTVGEPGGSAPTRRIRLAVDERRARLLALGQEFFASRKYHDVSIDAIARYAGISKGLLYRYFPSKREYYVALVQAMVSTIMDSADLRSDMTPRERLAHHVEVCLDYAARHPELFVGALRAENRLDPEVCAVMMATRQSIIDQMLTTLGDSSPHMRNALRGWLGFAEEAILDWLNSPEQIAREELGVMIGEMACSAVSAVRVIGDRSAAQSDEPAA